MLNFLSNLSNSFIIVLRFMKCKWFYYTNLENEFGAYFSSKRKANASSTRISRLYKVSVNVKEADRQEHKNYTPYDRP